MVGGRFVSQEMGLPKQLNSYIVHPNIMRSVTCPKDMATKGPTRLEPELSIDRKQRNQEVKRSALDKRVLILYEGGRIRPFCIPRNLVREPNSRGSLFTTLPSLGIRLPSRKSGSVQTNLEGPDKACEPPTCKEIKNLQAKLRNCKIASYMCSCVCVYIYIYSYLYIYIYLYLCIHSKHSMLVDPSSFYMRMSCQRPKQTSRETT